MSKLITTQYMSPVGELIIASYNEQLCLCDWQQRKAREQVDKRLKRALNAEYYSQATEFNLSVIRQLAEYFDNKRKTFDFPLLLVGTDFQKKVWQGLMAIPYGATASYGELATNLGMPSAVRAVANANGANGLSIIVPCHRIIGTNGKLTGYAGGLAAKKALLTLES